MIILCKDIDNGGDIQSGLGGHPVVDAIEFLETGIILDGLLKGQVVVRDGIYRVAASVGSGCWF